MTQVTGHEGLLLRVRCAKVPGHCGARRGNEATRETRADGVMVSKADQAALGYDACAVIWGLVTLGDHDLPPKGARHGEVPEGLCDLERMVGRGASLRALVPGQHRLLHHVKGAGRSSRFRARGSKVDLLDEV